MAIDFPASPTNGQTFTSGSVTYTWDGTKWTAVAAAGSSNSITQGNTNATVTDTGSDGRFVVTTEGSERARIDSSGRLLVGTNSAPDYNMYGQKALVNIVGADGLGLERDENSSSSTSFNFKKSRASTANGVTVVQNGDDIGRINWIATDGSNPIKAAEIYSQVDGTPGAGDMPGRLIFATTADGASSPTERMRLASNGDLTCPGVYSNTTAAAANVVVSTSPYYILRSTSSIKYKTNVEDIDPAYSAKLLDCRPVWFRSTCSIDNPNWSHWGFIAEEVASIDPRLVHWKTKDRITQEDGTQVEIELDTPEPEGVQYDRFVPHLLNLIKRQGEAIADLQAEVAALKAQPS